MTTLRNNMISTFGSKGVQWLENLPLTIENLKKKWTLKTDKKVSNLTYNYVEIVKTSKDKTALLKIGLNEGKGSREEVATNLLNPQRIRKIYSSHDNALLLEFINPGYTLNTVKNKEDRIKAGIDLLKDISLPKKEAVNLPTYRELLLEAIDLCTRERRGGNNYKAISNKAIEMYSRIEGGTPFITHGDFHHDNILFGEKGWVAIDPKGVIAPKLMDLGRFIINEEWNHCSSYNELILSLNYISKELGLSLDSLKEYGYIETVLAYSWWFQGDLSEKEYNTKVREMESKLKLYE